LPKFKKKNVQRSAKKKKKEAKPYTPFPPAQEPRKVDKQLESGEYFLSDEAKQAKRTEERNAKQAEGSAASKAKRRQRFEAPKEKAAVQEAPQGVRPSKAGPSATALAASVKSKSKRKRVS